jgi:hypothetical protein
MAPGVPFLLENMQTSKFLSEVVKLNVLGNKIIAKAISRKSTATIV